MPDRAAAFGRLCVETSGDGVSLEQCAKQPPSGGCVLKPQFGQNWWNIGMQPPSGGCVLKLENNFKGIDMSNAAAFGRLCVETSR